MNKYFHVPVVPKFSLNEEAQPKVSEVMDNSGSMGEWSKNMVNTVFPEMLRRTGLAPEDEVLLILFATSTEHHRMTVAELETFVLPRQGATSLSAQLLCFLDAAAMDPRWSSPPSPPSSPPPQ